MMLNNLLSTVVQTYEGFGTPFELNWLGQFIKILIESFGSIGLGIIMFTVLLKLLTLPLDIYSRVSMKKNALKLDKMRPQLEKLQRQYANDKALYSQKMQALYKKEGYSMMSSCLPTLVTLIVFIVVINQFSNYSRYTNLEMINNMANAYTQKIEQVATEDTNGYYVVEKNAEDKIETIYLSNKLFQEDEYFASLRAAGITQTAKDGKTYEAEYTSTDINACGKLLKEYNEKGYSYYLASEKFTETAGTFAINWDGWDKNTITEQEINKNITTDVVEFAYEQYRKENIKPLAREAARLSYVNDAPSFLWVKNLWVPDLFWKHPVFENLSEYDFYSSLSDSDKNKQAEYAEITAGLSEQKAEPNGYLILVVLSIGVMLVSQLIINRMQKPQLELQSVDGQAAQTSKMMMWMMPIMFGFFAFIYTASFSIYMIVSSLLSTAFTLIINKLVEIKFNKKIEEERLKNDKRFKK